ncbi:NTP transferase domain-containing protein [Devosia sp.]|uniref:molybdenum cofactor guanylyltransferase n=1 Tax=Devosia sp. TaxID=1871048 RepID=UPI0032650FEF
MTIAGVILAGGQGQRLGGVRKAHLKLGGVMLIDRVIRALALPPGAIIVSIGHLNPNAFAGGPVPVPDLTADIGGPLAGLAAAVDYLLMQREQPEFIIGSAVDVPFLPSDFLARLQTRLGDGAAAYAQVGDTFYPTNALWRFSAITDLPQLVRSGTAPKSLKHLLQSLDAIAVDWPDTPNPFANINTMADLIALSRRLE